VAHLGGLCRTLFYTLLYFNRLEHRIEASGEQKQKQKSLTVTPAVAAHVNMAQIKCTERNRLLFVIIIVVGTSNRQAFTQPQANKRRYIYRHRYRYWNECRVTTTLLHCIKSAIVVVLSNGSYTHRVHSWRTDGENELQAVTLFVQAV